MAQQQEQDRTEPATPYKLQEAKRKGQVAKSMELNSFIVLAAALGIAYAWAEVTVVAQLGIHRSLFSNAHQIGLQGQAVSLFGAIFFELVRITGLLVAGLMAAGILANVLQTGPILTGHPMKADFNRLNPAANLKRMFSSKLLFELVKTLVKLAVLGGVLYLTLRAAMPVLLGAMDRDPHSYAQLLIDEGRSLAFKLIAVLVLVALLDVLYVRWDYARQMRMSRRELKEEVRRREGDPHVRAKLRELQREAAKRAGSLARVPEADVVITNPTHLAVALRYERGEMPAPVVLAKGAAELAQKIRDVARQHRIPVVEDRALARTLFREAQVEQAIPEPCFPAVAVILAKIFRERQALAESGGPA